MTSYENTIDTQFHVNVEAINMLRSCVLTDGTLDDKKILKREVLYEGMNGKYVERFYLAPDKSYIFKPLTNEEQKGKESWVYEHILKDFPPFYPKLLAYSNLSNDQNWGIYEDLGAISHVFTEELSIQVAKYIAWWHDYPIEQLRTSSLTGPKPKINSMIQQVILNREKLTSLLSSYHLSMKLLPSIYQQLENITFSSPYVLSHGDLHLGNYGYAKGRIVIIDWEHTHLNLPYWDLFHLLDISHPIFPKVITKDIRNNTLYSYLDERKISTEKRKIFLNEYYLFSVIFSMWMLLLIKSDLEQITTKWSRNQLLNQLDQSIKSVIQCIEEISNGGDNKYGKIN